LALAGFPISRCFTLGWTTAGPKKFRRGPILAPISEAAPKISQFEFGVGIGIVVATAFDIEIDTDPDPDPDISTRELLIAFMHTGGP
jgi:hypothetical protein